MLDIRDDLIQATNDFDEIKSAIEAKGVTVGNAPTSDYGDLIETIPSYVEPSLQNKTIQPLTSVQNIEADQGYDGLGRVTINGVDNTIDQNIQAGNIKSGVTILGVQGTYQGGGGSPSLQNKTVTPSTSQQSVQCDSGYDGLDTVTVEAVTNAIDSDIVAGNIKDGINILGITGNYTGDTEVASCIKEYDANGLNLYSSVINLAKPNGSNLSGQNWAVVLNGVIHVFSDNSHYTYDPTNDSFTLIDTNSAYEYKVTDNNGIGGCVVGDKIVWVTGAPFKVYYWSVADGLVANTTFVCPDATYARSVCSDGGYLYVAGSNSGKLYKIDITNKTFTTLNLSVSGPYSLAYLDGYVYGHKNISNGNKLYKIDVSTGAETEVMDITGFKGDTIPVLIGSYIYYLGANDQTYDKYIWKFDGTTLTVVSTNAYASYNRGYFVYNNELYSIGINRTNSFVKLGAIMSGIYNYVTTSLGTTMYVYSGNSPVVETTGYSKLYKLLKSENFIIVKDNKVITYNIVNNKVFVKAGMTVNGTNIYADQLYDVSSVDQVYIKYT